jgi:hypothetical protein
MLYRLVIKGRSRSFFLGVQEEWAGPCPHGKRFARWKWCLYHKGMIWKLSLYMYVME